MVLAGILVHVWQGRWRAPWRPHEWAEDKVQFKKEKTNLSAAFFRVWSAYCPLCIVFCISASERRFFPSIRPSVKKKKKKMSKREIKLFPLILDISSWNKREPKAGTLLWGQIINWWILT